MTRYAIIRNARTRREVESYMPGNYRVIHDDTEQLTVFSSTVPGGSVPTGAPRFIVVIEGEDKQGWGLDTYVRPRLSSGLMSCEEIGLDHPIMKMIPVQA